MINTGGKSLMNNGENRLKELLDAAKKMNQILHQCEEEGDNMDAVLNKISSVKVHGVTFPTLMLLEIIDKFSEGYKDMYFVDRLK